MDLLESTFIHTYLFFLSVLLRPPDENQGNTLSTPCKRVFPTSFERYLYYGFNVENTHIHILRVFLFFCCASVCLTALGSSSFTLSVCVFFTSCTLSVQQCSAVGINININSGLVSLARVYSNVYQHQPCGGARQFVFFFLFSFYSFFCFVCFKV